MDNEEILYTAIKQAYKNGYLQPSGWNLRDFFRSNFWEATRGLATLKMDDILTLFCGHD